MKKNYLKILFLTVIAGLLFSCSEQKIDKLEKVSQIIGNWQSFNNPMNLGEKYSRIDDSTISGVTFMLRDADTIFLEKIEINSRNGKIFYLPTIIGKNEPPIPFEFKKDSANHIIFMNEKHDFPQRIVYQFVGKDSIYAFIDGNSSGVYLKNDFQYNRVK